MTQEWQQQKKVLSGMQQNYGTMLHCLLKMPNLCTWQKKKLLSFAKQLQFKRKIWHFIVPMKLNHYVPPHMW